MRRTALIQQLEAAKEKAKIDQAQIDRQKLVIEALTLSGSEAGEARHHLRTLEEAQDNHLADMVRILNALDALPAE